MTRGRCTSCGTHARLQGREDLCGRCHSRKQQRDTTEQASLKDL